MQAMTPNAIAENFKTTRQAVSKHIKILTECSIVKPQEAGREIYYYVDAKSLKEVDDFIEPFRQLWENKFNQLDKLLKQIKK